MHGGRCLLCIWRRKDSKLYTVEMLPGQLRQQRQKGEDSKSNITVFLLNTHHNRTVTGMYLDQPAIVVEDGSKRSPDGSERSPDGSERSAVATIIVAARKCATVKALQVPSLVTCYALVSLPCSVMQYEQSNTHKAR